MSYSKYLRDNLCHSYSVYDLDEDEDVSTINKVSARHGNVHDPHIEINNPDTDEEFDVGVSKNSYQVQEEYDLVTQEDFNINRGGYR
jgi:hypothetical protein